MANLNLEKKQIDLVRESLAVYKTCNECIDLFRKGELRFSVMEEFVDDRGVSCLYRLKQMCHDLFRNAEEAAYKEKFYDMTVGYIFHEAMKLRENVYQLEYYTPLYNALSSSDELTVLEKKVIREFDLLIGRARKRLELGLKEVKTLLKELVTQLKDLLRLYEGNYLLPRFILDNGKAFIKIYGKKGFQNLLNDMYDQGRATLVLKAGLSYLDSEYYQIARGLFQKSMQMNRSVGTARFLFLYASAFNLYFKNRFVSSQSFVDQALAEGVNDPEMTKYVESLHRLSQDLSRELKGMARRKETKNADL